jgi:hypothetical protein
VPHGTSDAVFRRILEAPPGFEPGMEVLQIQRGRESCCLVLVSGLSSSPVLPRVRALLDYVRTNGCTVPTATGRVLFVLVVLSHVRRRIVHVNVTEQPTATWGPPASGRRLSGGHGAALVASRSRPSYTIPLFTFEVMAVAGNPGEAR